MDSEIVSAIRPRRSRPKAVVRSQYDELDDAKMGVIRARGVLNCLLTLTHSTADADAYLSDLSAENLNATVSAVLELLRAVDGHIDAAVENAGVAHG